MQLCGFNKTTLLDYPAMWRPPFSRAAAISAVPSARTGISSCIPGQLPALDEEEIFRVLKKRRGVLTGVCVTGGEPTLQPDLGPFF